MHSRDSLTSFEKKSSPKNIQQGPLIALVGSANSGKTTLFNLLTGSHYSTVNYPGATVEYTLGQVKFDKTCRVMDTPGLTSLLPSSPDEKVTVESLFDREKPDLILAVVDATQLSRHLYLVRQLKEFGFNVVLAVTMLDLLEARGQALNIARLSEMLELPVIGVDPRSKQDFKALASLLSSKLLLSATLHKRYADFAQEMTEERITQYYQALDAIEKMVMVQNKTIPVPKKSIDNWLLHPVFGLVIFLAAMFAIFTSIFWLATPFMDAIDSVFSFSITFAKTHLPQSWIVDMFADGLVGGIGAVSVFLPQIIILFFCMGYLEDSGYLARGAALVDKPLSKIGLNGKSFVPLLSGYACAIPAIMAARTIPNRFERMLTIFIIPLMSCSARLPVYTLMLAFLTPHDKPWIGGLALTGLYLMGITMGAIVSTVISKFLSRREVSGFILELPALRKPVFRVVVLSTYHKAKQYIQKAGMTIVIISLSLWVLTHTPPQNMGKTVNVNSEVVSEYVAVSHSYAAQLGHILEPITKPMGLDWRGGVAMISGFAAREVFVSALALMYRIEDQDQKGLEKKILARMSEVKFENSDQKVFTLSSVLGIILFFMIALQCFPTVAIARKEMGNWKIPLLQLVIYTGGAYALTVILVQGLRALGLP